MLFIVSRTRAPGEAPFGPPSGPYGHAHVEPLYRGKEVGVIRQNPLPKDEVEVAGKRYKFSESAQGLELVHSTPVDAQVHRKRQAVLNEITQRQQDMEALRLARSPEGWSDLVTAHEDAIKRLVSQRDIEVQLIEDVLVLQPGEQTELDDCLVTYMPVGYSRPARFQRNESRQVVRVDHWFESYPVKLTRLLATPDGSLLGVDDDSNLHLISTDFVLERRLTRLIAQHARPFQQPALVSRYLNLRRAMAASSKHILGITMSGRHPVVVSLDLQECDSPGPVSSDVGAEILFDLAASDDSMWGIGGERGVQHVFRLTAPTVLEVLRDVKGEPLVFQDATRLCFVAGCLLVLCQSLSKCGWRAWGHSLILEPDGTCTAASGVAASRVELPADACVSLPFVGCSASGSNLCLASKDLIVTFDALNAAASVRKIFRDAQGHKLDGEILDAVELEGQVYIATKSHGVVRAASKKQEAQQAGACVQQ